METTGKTYIDAMPDKNEKFRGNIILLISHLQHHTLNWSLPNGIEVVREFDDILSNSVHHRHRVVPGFLKVALFWVADLLCVV